MTESRKEEFMRNPQRVKSLMFKKYLYWTFLFTVAASNFFVGAWLFKILHTPFGWQVASLSSDHIVEVHEFLSILQFVLIGFTFDNFFRFFIKRYNHRHPDNAWSDILIQASVVVFYGLTGFIGFIALFDHSLNSIIASTSALGFFVTFAARNLISDIVSSVALQKNKLLTIGDWIELREFEVNRYQVKKMDFRYVTLLNDANHLTKITNQRFLTMPFVNISQQPNGSLRQVDLQVGVHNNEDRIIEILESAADYVCNTIPGFIPNFNVSVIALTPNMATYRILFRCEPSISFIKTQGIMTRQALRFLKGAGIILGPIGHSRTATEIAQTAIETRFMELYPYGVLKVLNIEDARYLASRVQLVQFSPTSFITQQGNNETCMYLIAEGCVEVFINKDGSSLSIVKLWPGDCFGEMSLLTGEARSASVVANKFSKLLQINKEDIEPLLRKDAFLVEKLSQLLAERNAHNEEKINQISQASFINQNRQSIAQRIFNFFSIKLN